MPCRLKGRDNPAYKHGMSHTREYVAWRNMMNRCYKPSEPYYPSYGGRGIRVCKKWHKFEGFYADMGDKPEGKRISLDRINNSGNYCKRNCRWATPQQQNSNKSNCIILDGKTLSQHARDVGIGLTTLKYRLDNGWPLKEALTIPPKHSNRKPT